MRKETLKKLNEQLAADPDSVGLRFERACLLTESGQTEEAKLAYLDLLARSPGHAGALNNFGTLLCDTGFRSAARIAYAEAVKQHPEDPMGHVNLANLLLAAGELAAAREHYETALAHDPMYRGAHQGLGNLLAELGEEEASREHQRLGHRQATLIPHRGETKPVSVVLLVSSGRGGNVPIRHLLDDRVYQTFAIAPEFWDLDVPLPPHQLVVNSIGDADLCAAALEAAVNLVERSMAPVVNAPAAVLGTGRMANARRLAGLAGVIAPRVAQMSREKLAQAAGLTFPLLLRAPGFHNGRHFVKLESAAELPGAIESLPGNELTAIQFLDARGRDGNFRKYRVMMIAGELYPLHLAISHDWKIHYVTADMADNAQHRAEEARFLENMPEVVGARAMAALRSIQETLALDYAGIDFGLSPAGDVLLFEANATMVIVPPGADERWSYRRNAVECATDAVRRMLLEKAAA
ncbi:MAG TPA: tetratricopeptide repeat protein [Bryobacteraceae bacterium]|nr:tetratricopeptide repeat protein [Bryobacteraceae bacterium]